MGPPAESSQSVTKQSSTSNAHIHTYYPRQDNLVFSTSCLPVAGCLPIYVTAMQPFTTAQPVICQQPIITHPGLLYHQTPSIPMQTLPTSSEQSGPSLLGATALETLQMQMALPKDDKINQAQEMKPGDDDPFRMYWVKELNGQFTMRNRMTIESGDIGECRWYSYPGGPIYAVRQS